MDKIKENVVPLVERIRAYIFVNPISSAKLRMNVAENVFIFSAFLYFFFTLMAVGGFLPYFSSLAVFLLYPVFVLSIFVLIFAVINYWLAVYLEHWLFLRYIAFVVLIVGYLILLARHLDIYSFLISFLWISR